MVQTTCKWWTKDCWMWLSTYILCLVRKHLVFHRNLCVFLGTMKHNNVIVAPPIWVMSSTRRLRDACPVQRLRPVVLPPRPLPWAPLISSQKVNKKSKIACFLWEICEYLSHSPIYCKNLNVALIYEVYFFNIILFSPANMLRSFYSADGTLVVTMLRQCSNTDGAISGLNFAPSIQIFISHWLFWFKWSLHV